MSQDVTIAGASYEDVPSIDVPTTGGGTSSFYDVSDTTATAADVASGKVFYAADGAQTVGTASGGGNGVSVFYGTCATTAATAAKVVVCEEFTSDDLVEGAVINVKFVNAQTYNGAPTLNVNSTGAKNIKRVGTTNAARYEWQAGEVVQFVYDGTYWMLTDGGIATTTYYGVTKLSSATNSTSTSLAATASAVKAAYDLAHGKQDALVSGTNIKTVNGDSILGSGDLTVGGSVSYAKQAVSIAASAWSGTTATVSASAVTAGSDVIVAPAPASISAWAAAGVYCSAQGAGTLTFACDTVPTAALTANVMAFEGGGSVATYEVTNGTNGSASIDKTAAAEGETVTITSRIVGGSFSVFETGNSSNVLFTFGSVYGSTYSFVMPAFAVTVGWNSAGGGSND